MCLVVDTNKIFTPQEKKIADMLKTIAIFHWRTFRRYRSMISFTPQHIENVSPIFHENGIRSYDEVPGPKPLPIIGNSWRFLPVIGELIKCMLDDYIFLTLFLFNKRIL